jgi:hypothetical protein
LASAFVAAGLLLIVAAQQSRAASAPPSACPDGFHWERMSGVGCVQTTLPPHGQYTDTSAAICSEPYIAQHAPGPNLYGTDPNANYLVACLTAQEAAALASTPPGPATPAPQRGGGGTGGDGTKTDLDDNHGLGTGPLDKLAESMLDDGQQAPDQRDAGLGGVAATGVLLLSIAGGVIVGGSGGLPGLTGGTGAGGAFGAGGGAAGGGSSGAGGSFGPADPSGSAGAAGSGHGSLPGGQSSATVHAGAGAQAASGGATIVPHVATADQAATAAGGFSLPVPRVEMVQGGLSIFRSMKRVTEDANPTGYSPGDVAQMLGDAAGIALLASAMSSVVGVVSLAASGAAAATDVKSPQEIFDQMRRNLGRLGYMQGVLDENVSHVDKQLGDLDVSADADAAPPPPADPTTLSAKDLKVARTEWAPRADAAFDALGEAQTELDDLDARRSNLANQIDKVGDLLMRIDQMARIDQTGSVLLPDNLAATISYGRGWYFAGGSSKMAAALRESFAGSRAAGTQRRVRARGTNAAAASDSGSAAPNAVTLVMWAEANRIEDGRLAVLQALAGLERWRGFYDALTGSVQVRIGSLRLAADQAVAARRDLAAEVQRRALQGPGK